MLKLLYYKKNYVNLNLKIKTFYSKKKKKRKKKYIYNIFSNSFFHGTQSLGTFDMAR